MEELFKFLANGSIDDIERLCGFFGVNIIDNNGNYKTIDKVFTELSLKFKTT